MILVRRSNLIVPLMDKDATANAWRHHADAITLDLESAERDAKPAARGLIAHAAASARRGGAEVFVCVDKNDLRDDLAAAVQPHVTGIMLGHVDSAEEVLEAASLLDSLERDRGRAAGAAQMILLLASARAVWHLRAIVHSTARISQVGLNEPALARSLGIDIDPDVDPFMYARGRLAVEATAAKGSAIGMAYPLGAVPKERPAPEINALASKAKNLGMKGVVCPYASWVEPVNAAFTPAPELVHYNRRVREAFAAGVAAGTAAVPLDGRMIDVPVDEWAKVVLNTADACAARDAQKRAAVAAATG